MGHFSTFLMPVFVIYPVIFSIVHKSRAGKTLINILSSAPFAFLNLFLISGDIFTPKGDFIGFVKANGLGQVTTQIMLQISNLTLPPALIEKIASVTSSYQDILLIFTLPIIFVFFLGIYLIRKRQKNLSIIYILSLLSLFVLLFLNLYLGKVNPMHNMTGYTYYFLPTAYSSDPSLTASLKGDRYYLLPYLFVSIIVAILIFSLIKNKKRYKIFSTAFLVGYLFYNCVLVWKNIDKIQPVAEDLKKYLSFVKSISLRLNNESTLVVPREFLWPSSMIKTIYGYPDMKFAPNDADWKKQITNMKEVILIDFYYDKARDGKINVAQNRVIDLTGSAIYNLPKND
jgi:CRISPR/Cas system CSM-associated protein Csm2 small subunit